MHSMARFETEIFPFPIMWCWEKLPGNFCLPMLQCIPSTPGETELLEFDQTPSYLLTEN